MAARAGNLKCVRCDETKPVETFVNDRTRVSGKFPWCKACVMDRRRETKIEDAARERMPAQPGDRACPACLTSLNGMHAARVYCSTPCKDRARRWKTFGLEPDDYRKLVAATNGQCPICRRNVKKWVLDHNHHTGETTGVVCSTCNQSLLAYSGHDISIAQRLVTYLSSSPLRAALGEPRYVGPEALAQQERLAGWRKTKGYSIGLAKSQAVHLDTEAA